MGVFCQGITHLAGKICDFVGSGDDLFTDRVQWIVRIDQGGEIGGDVYPEQTGLAERLFFAFGQREDLFKILNGIQAMTELPAPVIPFLVRNIGKSRRTF